MESLKELLYDSFGRLLRELPPPAPPPEREYDSKGRPWKDLDDDERYWEEHHRHRHEPWKEFDEKGRPCVPPNPPTHLEVEAGQATPVPKGTRA